MQSRMLAELINAARFERMLDNEYKIPAEEDAYTLAVIANFAADSNRDKAWTNRSIDQLAVRMA